MAEYNQSVVTLKGVRYEPPDKNAHEEKIRLLGDEKRQIEEELDRMQKEHDSKSSGKEEYFSKKKDIRRDLDEISRKIDDKEKERKELFNVLDEKRKEQNESRRAGSRKVGGGQAYRSEEEIDQAIGKIEKTMRTSTLTLKQEKTFMGEIAKLKKDKLKIRPTTEITTAAPPTSNMSLDNAQETFQVVNADLLKFREKKKELSAKLADLTNERQKATQPLQEIFERKQELRNQKYKLNERIKQAKIDYNDTRERFKNAQREKRRQDDDKNREEREKKNLQKKIEDLENQRDNEEESPHDLVINLINQMISYVRKLAANAHKEETTETEKTPEKHEETVTSDGEEIVKPKKDRDEYYVIPTTKKKERRPQRKATKQKRMVTHPIQALTDFKQLDVEAPVSIDNIPDCIAHLETKLQEQMELNSMFMSEKYKKREDIEKELDALKISENESAAIEAK